MGNGPRVPVISQFALSHRCGKELGRHSLPLISASSGHGGNQRPGIWMRNPPFFGNEDEMVEEALRGAGRASCKGIVHDGASVDLRNT